MMGADLSIELLQATFASSAALLLVLLLRRVLRQKLGARIAYASWILVPLACMAVLAPAPAQELVLPASANDASGLPAIVYASLAAAPDAASWIFLLALWLSGALATACLFAHRQRTFNRRVEDNQKTPYGQVVGHGPAVAGLLRPRIVLPADFESRYTVEQQILVIAHERLHLQRGDIVAQALATLLRCVFWFNPLVHFGAARFRFDQELACDADVLAAYPNSRRTYGEAMLKTQLADFALPVGCHWQSSHPLKERIMMLSKPLPGTKKRVSGMALVLALVATGSYGAWASQPASPTASGHAKNAQGKLSSADPSMPGVGSITSADILTPPDYPAGISKSQPGYVVLELLVAVDGTVKEVRVVKSTPVGVFDEVSKKAAMQWRFNAARTTEGKKVEGWVRVPVEFAPHEPTEGAKAG